MPKNVQTSAHLHSSHMRKVMLKILQVRLQQYVNHELPDVQAGFRKGTGIRDQIANIRWIIKKARKFQKNIYFCFIHSASLRAQLVKNLLAMQETPVQFLGVKIHQRRDRLPTPVFLCFPCGSAGKESACNAGDLGLILGLGRSPGEGKGYPLQYSGLENSLDYTVHGVTKNQTRLSKFYHLFLLY